jgi:hypothetical protein
MSYRVEWLRTALDQLAAVWVGADDRTAVTQASHAIEKELTRDPLRFGEARTSSVVRVAFQPPLGVEFEVIADDRRVRVLRVWAAG